MRGSTGGVRCVRGSRGGAHDIIIYAYMHDVSQGDLGQVRARNFKVVKV